MHKLAVLANGKIGKNLRQISWRQEVTEFPLQKTVLFPGKYKDSRCSSQLRAQHRLVLVAGDYPLNLEICMLYVKSSNYVRAFVTCLGNIGYVAIFVRLRPTRWPTTQGMCAFAPVRHAIH